MVILPRPLERETQQVHLCLYHHLQPPPDFLDHFCGRFGTIYQQVAISGMVLVLYEELHLLIPRGELFTDYPDVHLVFHSVQI